MKTPTPLAPIADDIEDLERIGLQKLAGIFRQLHSVTLSLHYIAGVSETTVQEHAFAAIEELQKVMFDVRAVHFGGVRESATMRPLDEGAQRAISISGSGPPA